MEGTPMTNRDDFRFQPGWATPVVVDHGKPTFLAWFLGMFRKDPKCLAHRQGRCPGPNQCHDCTWSPQESQPNP
jgi:hypothetical protein